MQVNNITKSLIIDSDIGTETNLFFAEVKTMYVTMYDRRHSCKLSVSIKGCCIGGQTLEEILHA